MDAASAKRMAVMAGLASSVGSHHSTALELSEELVRRAVPVPVLMERGVFGEELNQGVGRADVYRPMAAGTSIELPSDRVDETEPGSVIGLPLDALSAGWKVFHLPHPACAGCCRCEQRDGAGWVRGLESDDPFPMFDAGEGIQSMVPRSGDPCEGGVAVLLAASNLVLAAGGATATVLWIIAVILVIAGIVTLIRGGVLMGIVLIIVGLLVGPGGVSIFTD